MRSTFLLGFDYYHFVEWSRFRHMDEFEAPTDNTNECSQPVSDIFFRIEEYLMTDELCLLHFQIQMHENGAAVPAARALSHTDPPIIQKMRGCLLVKIDLNLLIIRIDFSFNSTSKDDISLNSD